LLTDCQQWLINPWAQVTYNHQFGDTESTVRAGLKSTQTSFAGTAASGDKNWLDMSVGANVPLGETINAFAGVSTVASNSDYHQVTWNVGVNATF
jgi:outer membrane lipase/esterase